MSESEAATFNIPTTDRCLYIRLDSAKVNIVPRAGAATWFRLLGVAIGNATDQYPNGDTLQVVEPWQPPDTWSGTTVQGLNMILDAIARGLVDDDGKPTGQRYSNAPSAEERAVWPTVQRVYPQKPEAQCRVIIHAWLDTGLVYAKDYDDPVQRKQRKGLYVCDAKRPS